MHAQEWNIVLTSRIIFFLLKTHHHQIVANRVMRTALIPLRRNLREGLRRRKDTLGYNLAALRFVQRQNDARRTAEFFEREEALTEEQVREKIAVGGKKRKRGAGPGDEEDWQADDEGLDGEEGESDSDDMQH